mmetsp:Transcript_11923/g.25897  ORF Transcript_11923/g.25897 Transcript_11923/m.25897 type:complete len:274 (-) Transcript_11923:110-931(-)
MGVSVGEKHGAQSRVALVQDHHRTQLPEETPRCAGPQGHDTSLLDQDGASLLHGPKLLALDVALHAALKGVEGVAQQRDDGSSGYGGCDSCGVLGSSPGVRKFFLDGLSKDRGQAQDTCAVESLSHADAEGSPSHHRRAASDQVRRSSGERGAFALLLDHGQLDGAADEAGEVARAERSGQLLRLGQVPVFTEANRLLDKASADKLKHHAGRVVQAVRGVPSVEHTWVRFERKALLGGILPIVGGLKEGDIKKPADGTQDRVLALGEILRHIG